MMRQSVLTKLSKVKDRAAVFYIDGEYQLILSTNPGFDNSIEKMTNQCMGVYNKKITEKRLNEDMVFMEARQ